MDRLTLLIVLFAPVTVRLVFDILVAQSMTIVDERPVVTRRVGRMSWTDGVAAVRGRRQDGLGRLFDRRLLLFVLLLVDGLEPHLHVVHVHVQHRRCQSGRWRRRRCHFVRHGRRGVQGGSGCAGCVCVVVVGGQGGCR